MNKKNLCVVAGGSGGHILPAIVLAKRWMQQNKDGKVFFFVNNKKLDKQIVESNKFFSKLIFLSLINFPGKKIWRYPKFFAQFFINFFKSIYFLRKHKVNQIISTGGFLAISVSIAGKILGCKINLYELNVEPGKAVKFLSYFADKIFVTFEKSKNFFAGFSDRCFVQNYPLRFAETDKIFEKQDLFTKINRKFLVDFGSSKKTIFLLGGSQGSVFLNNLFKSCLENNKLIRDKIQVIHQTGFSDLTSWKTFYFDKNIQAAVFSFDSNIKDFYLVSDLIISRAGAGALFELEFFQKKSLLVPLKTKYTSHQILNAQEVALRNPTMFSVLDQNKLILNSRLFDQELNRLLFV